MAVSINQKTQTYLFGEKEHKLWDILEHFGVQWGRADEMREKVFAVCHERYYGKPATPNQLFVRNMRFLSSEQELPTSVLSLYCCDNKLLPKELYAKV